MKYQDAYEQINDIMTLVRQPPILPIENCQDDAIQIRHLYTTYLDRFLTTCPQWAKFKDRPGVINDIGVQFLLTVLK